MGGCYVSGIHKEEAGLSHGFALFRFCWADGRSPRESAVWRVQIVGDVGAEMLARR